MPGKEELYPDALQSSSARPKWIMVGTGLLVLAVLGGGAFFFRDRLFPKTPTNTATTAQQVKNPSVIPSVAEAQQQFGFSREEAQRRIQFATISMLWMSLREYQRSSGDLPESLSVLQERYPALLETCRQTSDCNLLPVEGKVEIRDAYTSQVFPYVREGADYRLTYLLRSCGKDCDAERDKDEGPWAKIGTNTMTKTAFSQEAGSVVPVANTNPPLPNANVNPNDPDSDGLTSIYEEQLSKTDPAKADTDADGIIDGLEVIDYKTDPTKADSDGDGFPDGQEVRGSYDPNGSGRCAQTNCVVP